MTNVINWIGIDDSAARLVIAQYVGAESRPAKQWELSNRPEAIRRLIGWIKSLSGESRVVYEAGACGYELYRRLRQAKVHCEVAAPSLTPRRPGDRIKTDRRDAAKLGHLYRSGELTLIAVPDGEQEAVRDVVRAREAVGADLLRARHQLSKLLLRHGARYEGGQAWTQRHWAWIHALRFEGHTQTVISELILSIEQRQEQVRRYDQLIEQIATQGPNAEAVRALSVLRGVRVLTAMTILCELGDLRRFHSAPQLMAAVGLVPSEYSSGEKTRRYAITKAGNAHVRRVVIEAAWQYTRRPTTSGRVELRRREQPRQRIDCARRCDLRLYRRYQRLVSRGKRPTLAVTAIARELTGFIWAIGQTL
jgi:transposase